MNLLCGVLGVIFTLEGNVGTAFVLMLGAAAADFLDGLAARMLHSYSDIGKELDSLADTVSFGVLPSVMMYKTMAMLGGPGLPCYLPLFLAVMSALRLAKFNMDERQSTDFIGLPTPSAALLCGSACHFIFNRPDSLLAGLAAGRVFLPLASVILGLLLVSEIPMFSLKFKKSSDTPVSGWKRTALFSIAAICIIVTAVTGSFWSLAVMLIFTAYILMNIIFALFNI